MTKIRFTKTQAHPNSLFLPERMSTVQWLIPFELQAREIREVSHQSFSLQLRLKTPEHSQPEKPQPQKLASVLLALRRLKASSKKTRKSTEEQSRTFRIRRVTSTRGAIKGLLGILLRRAPPAQTGSQSVEIDLDRRLIEFAGRGLYTEWRGRGSDGAFDESCLTDWLENCRLIIYESSSAGGQGAGASLGKELSG